MVTLSSHQWIVLQKRLCEEHPRSVMLIRDVMRRELGFTVRYHYDFGTPDRRLMPDKVYLDFFNDHLETWFRLKYAEYF